MSEFWGWVLAIMIFATMSWAGDLEKRIVALETIIQYEKGEPKLP